AGKLLHALGVQPVGSGSRSDRQFLPVRQPSGGLVRQQLESPADACSSRSPFSSIVRSYHSSISEEHTSHLHSPTEIYTLSLHDALTNSAQWGACSTAARVSG